MSRHLKLNNTQACHDFLATHSASEIAAQIRRDRDACRNKGIPSDLVYILPRGADDIAKAINSDPCIPLPIARLQYSNIVSGIKDYLSSLSYAPAASPIPEYMIPTDDDFNAALKVLQYLQLPNVGALKNSAVPLQKVVETIHEYLLHGPELREAEVKLEQEKLCYVCRFSIRHPHKLYASLCNPCGEFNLASSALSLPHNLNLCGKTALVTGGRVNLGYHTALRLLRCGAKVAVSSRYPYDAETRYSREADFDDWKDRLKIVGADFRTAKDVFALVTHVKRIMEEWRGSRNSTSGKPALNILVNNAAQTLTDSIEKEAENIQQELNLADNSKARLVVDNAYRPQVRGGHQGYIIGSSDSREKLMIEGMEKSMAPDPQVVAEVAIKSSWTQGIGDIPYEDVVSAHSVNTFVPFILLRELLPLMSSRAPKPTPNTTTSTPVGYVINVSSREGMFEKNPKASAKSGLHVHTNMSKAALNMLTETEAASCWQKYKVAINSVDPGYMSADPMFMKTVGRENEECPIGWEDGAGRVLWPIAKGEHGQAVWGRFLKHFREIEVGR